MANIVHGELSYQVIGSAMEVHRTLGPGFLESVYQKALAHELLLRQVAFAEQVPLIVRYKEAVVKEAVVGDFIADFVIDTCIIIEIKAISTLHPKHEAQTLNYITLTGFRLGLLINFGAHSLQYKRIVK
ncbi:GxxExxY protein [Herpetosiphon giganteus]|uniref:GxxExxY protein n=1 Tax=Herpetosiphon giganteus TaxID=2029754 RepID=UPI00195794C0|nr:GxxExxY protein [Herpetosiphon giganteus]MBM7842508.1 GxxExxY protein [Herpetosiphon giganteus]